MNINTKNIFLQGYIKALENMSYDINSVPIYECKSYELSTNTKFEDFLRKSIVPNKYKNLIILDNWKIKLRKTIKNKIDSKLVGGKTKDKHSYYSEAYMHYWNGLYDILTDSSDNLVVWSFYLLGEDFILPSVEAFAFIDGTNLIILSFDESD